MSAMDLDFVSFELEKAKDCLAIFVELVGEEGYNLDEVSAKYFAEKVVKYTSVVYAAFDKIDEQQKEIERIAEKLSERLSNCKKTRDFEKNRENLNLV